MAKRRDYKVVLKAKRQPKFKTLNDVAYHIAKKHPGSANFPDIPRPTEHERSILDLGLQ